MAATAVGMKADILEKRLDDTSIQMDGLDVRIAAQGGHKADSNSSTDKSEITSISTLFLCKEMGK